MNKAIRQKDWRKPVKVRIWRTILAHLLLGCSALGFLSSAWGAPDPIYNKIDKYLIGQGFHAEDISRWLNDPRLRFKARLMARMLSLREANLNYAQFLFPKSLALARKFKKRHNELLFKAEKRFGVAPEVVVAIILVETRLGAYQGNYLLFNTLASQACLDRPLARTRLRPHWPQKQIKDLYSADNKKRFSKRAAWARRELGALIHVARNAGKPLYSFKGSPAGAMGIPQFVPTSVLRHGVDGSGDGKVDLRQPADAIFSVAKYLKDHGWRKGLSLRKQAAVLLTYNRSLPYTRTVLEAARRLR